MTVIGIGEAWLTFDPRDNPVLTTRSDLELNLWNQNR